ncbi:MAG TPA: PQQ-binding-like beta-propeller repeat protein [Humisphaera sp.]
MGKVWIKSVLAAAVGFGLAGAAATAATAEWPKYLGPENTGISTEKIAEKWPEGGPKKLWSAKVGAAYSSPVALDGTIYFFGREENEEVLTAFDADTGKVAWRDAAKVNYRVDYPGTRATPTIDGGVIYTYGGGGMVVARDLRTGKPTWTADAIKAAGSSGLLEWGQASAPLVRGDHVIVQAGKGGAVAVAFEKATGKVAWLSEAKGTAGYAQVVPVDVAGKPQLVVFAGEAVLGVDPATGKTLWQQPWKTSYDVNAATPVYDGKGNLFVASGYGTGGGMFTLSAAGAEKAWGVNSKLKCKFQPPIKDGDTVYLVSEDGRGTIKAMSWPDGKINWELKDPKVGFGGSLVRVGSFLIAQAQTGEIHLIKADPKAAEKVSSFKPFEGSDKVWSMPIVYRGKLFAKGPDELVAFDIK